MERHVGALLVPTDAVLVERSGASVFAVDVDEEEGVSRDVHAVSISTPRIAGHTRPPANRRVIAHCPL